MTATDATEQTDQNGDRTRGVFLSGDVLEMVEQVQREDNRSSLVNAAQQLIREGYAARRALRDTEPTT